MCSSDTSRKIAIHDDRARGGGKIIMSVGNIIVQPGKKRGNISQQNRYMQYAARSVGMLSRTGGGGEACNPSRCPISNTQALKRG